MNDTPFAPRDRFSMSYGLWCGACLLVLISSHEMEVAYGPVGLLVALLALLAAAILVIWMAFAIARHLVARRWRRVASILIGPPAAFAIVALSVRIGLDPTWVRFETRKAAFIQELPQPAERPRMKSWPWGTTGLVITASSEYTILFDESDEVALPQPQRSVAWHERLDQEGIASILNENYPISVRKLDNHFYLVEQMFP